MHFVDLTQVALRTLQSSAPVNPEQIDQHEAHSLLGKIIGVLIRQGRLAAERSAEECAHSLDVDLQLFEAWELGASVPSLPQLEQLASCFNAPSSDESPIVMNARQREYDEYLRLRQRLVGALLQSARHAQDSSLEDLSASTGLDADLLKRYEFGESTIPVHHLTTLAQAVKRDLSYFTESRGFDPNRRHPAAVESVPEYDTDADIVTFVRDCQNRSFIRLAMAFRDIDREDLDRLASALFAIIRDRRDANGQSPQLQ